MTPEEFLQLHALVEDVTLHDVHVGQVLDILVARVARLEGLDPDKVLAEQAERDAEPVAEVAPVEEKSAEAEHKADHSRFHSHKEGKK